MASNIWKELDKSNKAGIILKYWKNIANMDQQLIKIWESLDTRGRYIGLLLLPPGWYWICHVTRDRFGRASSNILGVLRTVTSLSSHSAWGWMRSPRTSFIINFTLRLHSHLKIHNLYDFLSKLPTKTDQSDKVLWARPETGLTPFECSRQIIGSRSRSRSRRYLHLYSGSARHCLWKHREYKLA